ncbi:AMP-binding protein, partial [Streptomyces sp. NPDC005322]|uniref:non-ribosomal peptide synthetase n=1 Tax=Streptomyces sp. NPDC005322 TaxID=3157032 RepID=UPI0033BF5D70
QALAGVPEELQLPTDRPRPAIASHRGGSVDLHIPAQLHTRLTELARAEGVTLFMVLQAALAVLLSKLGAGEDIPIGTPIAGRTDDTLDDLVGFFVNTLVLRTDTSGNPTFRELLARVRETSLAAYAHQDIPFERLVEDLAPTRSMARHPLFQISLTLQSDVKVPLALPGVQAELRHPAQVPAKFDLNFDLSERFTGRGETAGVDGQIDYALDLYDRQTVEEVAARLIHILEQVAADSTVGNHTIDVLSPAEYEIAAQGWDHTAGALAELTLPMLFEAQVARTPDAVAVVSGESGVSGLTYAELNDRANRLAHHLMGQGAGPERIIALALPRSADLVVTLLAILKAGAAYLPIDPDYPAERIAHMLTDTRPTLVMTSSAVAKDLPTVEGIPAVHVDDPAVVRALEASAASDPTDTDRGRLDAMHPAYVIYTSGSTGQPKGVLVPHQNVTRLFGATDHWFGFGADDVWTLFHSFAFDFSVWELWGPLLFGGRLVVVPFEVSREPAAF